MEKDNLSDLSHLRQMAEELLKMKTASNASVESQSELYRLIHEVEVHEIELQLQNHELQRATNLATINSEKYTQLFDFAPTGYFVLSREGDIIASNHNGRKILGREYQNLINQRFPLLISDESRPIFTKFLSDIFKKKDKGSCIVSISIEDKLPVYGHITGLVDEKTENCLINIIDISSLKLSEKTLENKIHELTITTNELEQAIQLNKAKDQLLAILGHDLRNQFTGLIGYSGYLVENLQNLNDVELKDIANQITNSAQNAYSLLDEILVWSKAQANRTTFEPQKLSFSDICREIIEFLKPSALAKTITLNCNNKTDITLFADKDMLKTVLRNLISNAIKFTDKLGVINIIASQGSGNVTISVSDNGTGISAESLPKLFDASQILTTQGTKGEKGTGLGLLLCKEFVEKHGGKIWAESELGKGSIFSFNIPQKTRYREKGSDKSKEVEAEINNLKILIADDNAAIRMILADLFRKYSREILFAKTGNEAVDIFRENLDVDLILMDSTMPQMNGNEATTLIREVDKKVIIFISTADEISKVTEDYAHLAINDYLPKPYNKFSIDQLVLKHFAGDHPK